MGTARLHKDNHPGFGGSARIYKLDPPYDNGGLGYRYVTVIVHPGQEHRNAEVNTYFTTAFGTPVRENMRRETGSFTCKGDPHQDGQHHIEGCYALSLGLLGYKIIED